MIHLSKRLDQWEIDQLIKQLQEDKNNVFNTDDNIFKVYRSVCTDLHYCIFDCTKMV